MIALNVYIIDRKTQKIKSFLRVDDFSINTDYLTNEKSSFTAREQVEADSGDFLIAKPINVSDIETNVLFFGVIDSFEANNIIACDIYDLVNLSFAATSKTGQSAEIHIKNLINKYLMADSSKNISQYFNITSSGSTAFSYQPSDPPTDTNLNDYLINMFKKYNVLWSFDSFSQSNDGTIVINTKIYKETNSFQIKNNINEFVNWEFYINEAGFGSENMLLIINNTTSDSENPNIRNTFYLETDGNIVNTLTNNVLTPTRHKIYIFDTEEQDPPTDLEIAMSELSGNLYSHEISFNIPIKNNILSFSSLKIGNLFNIVNANVIYRSVLTGFEITGANSFIKLKFGHVRSTMKEVLK